MPIIATIHLQRWDDNNYAEEVLQIQADVTRNVLKLTLHRIRGLKDSSTSSDLLAWDHLNGWPGPFYVEVEDAASEFFGVDDLDDVDASHVQDALEEFL